VFVYILIFKECLHKKICEVEFQDYLAENTCKEIYTLLTD